MRRYGKRLGRKELKKRIRGLVLSGAMTIAMAFSNMAGLIPATVQATTPFDNYFVVGYSPFHGYYPINSRVDLQSDIEASQFGSYPGVFYGTSGSLADMEIRLNGHKMDFHTDRFIYVQYATLNIYDSGSGEIISQCLKAQDTGKIVVNGGKINKISIGGFTGMSELELKGGHIEELSVSHTSNYSYSGGTIGRITEVGNSNFTGINFAPDNGTSEKNAVLVTAGDPYDLPNCTFTAPANKEFAGWNVDGEIKQEGTSITPTGDTNGLVTITATWRDRATTSQTNTPTQQTQTQTQTQPASTSGGSSYSYDYDDDDDYSPSTTDESTTVTNNLGTVATRDIALPEYTGRYKPTLTNNTGENPRAGLLTVSGQAVFTFKTTSGDDDSFDHFQGAQMDGMVLTQGSQYDVTRGSTIITLTKEYISSLDEGTHTLTMIFDDETLTVPFTKAGLLKSSPKMGED